MKTRPINTPENWDQLSPHPLSQLIEFGKGISVEAMADHMRTHGYDEDEPVILFEGMILDGRHRHAACKVVGISPPFREFCGKDATAYVAKKLFRQYPTVAERAKMAATYANLSGGRPKETPPNGGVNKDADDPPATPPMTTEQAAKTFGVSKRSVERAKANMKPKDGPTKTKPRKKPSDNGKVVFDWSEFLSHYGYMVRAIDKFGNAHQAKDSNTADQIRRQLQSFKDTFTNWVEFHTKEKAPRH